MKKVFVSWCLILTALAPAGVFSALRAQGFFVRNHPLSFSETRFKPAPQGHVVQALSLWPDICLSEQRLNGEGQELSWTTVCHVDPQDAVFFWEENNLIGWLNADTLLLSTENFTDPFLDFYKVALSGDTLWHSDIVKPEDWIYRPLQAAQNAEGEIFAMGEGANLVPPYHRQTFLAKFTSDGSLLWKAEQPLDTDNTINRIVLRPDTTGACAVAILFHNTTTGDFTATLHKYSHTGALLWSTAPVAGINPVLESSEGIVFALAESVGTPLTYQTRLVRYSDAGDLVWEQVVNPLIGAVNSLPASVVRAHDDGVWLVGRERNAGNNYLPFLARFGPSGNFLWKRTFPWLFMPGSSYGLSSAALTSDNGLVISGSLNSSLFVLKVDSNGLVTSSLVDGRISYDDDLDCVSEAAESPLRNWIVEVTGDDSQYSSTDANGNYFLGLPDGDYTLRAVPPAPLWDVCPPTAALSVPDTGLLLIHQNFSVDALVACPLMSVELSTARLRRCFPNTYYVHYCNDGTATADSAFVEISLPPFLDFNSASLPYMLENGVFRFLLGDVAALECGDFSFVVTPNCDSTELGQTLCISAAIFPDTICLPPADWSGATLVGRADCVGDSVQFLLKNEGSGPSTPGLDFVVVDDHVIMYQQPLPALQVGESYFQTVPAHGATLRFLAEQEPNHPASEPVSVGVEGCNGAIQAGLMLEFPNTDGRTASVRNCQEIVGAYDPNDKTATPRGVGDAHYLWPGTPLQYRIRFQNTGNDTAFTVVIRDTLSSWLDPASIRPGASSHDYQFHLSGAGILTFTYNNILLPDSNVNETASHGFVEFYVEQKPDIPLGAVLENRAGIYFDFNDPVITNTAWHTVDTGFLAVNITSGTPDSRLPELRLFPNPATSRVSVELPAAAFQAGDRLRLYDVFGRVAWEKSIAGHSAEINRGSLASGTYLLEWRRGDEVKGRGRLVFK